jgi:hypothetical protein
MHVGGANAAEEAVGGTESRSDADDSTAGRTAESDEANADVDISVSVAIVVVIGFA